jgi:hypothetical protein
MEQPAVVLDLALLGHNLREVFLALLQPAHLVADLQPLHQDLPLEFALVRV